jgi:hypothetical protein
MPYVSPPQTAPPPNFLSEQERVLLSVVPVEHREHLLRMLRSPDRAVRGMALVLIHLDRDSMRRPS